VGIEDYVQDAMDGDDDEKSRLNTVIALLVAMTATFMAICNVKAGNINQAMASDQTDIVDTWAYFQAKSTKQALAEASSDELTLQRDALNLPPESRAAYEKRIADLHGKMDKYEKEKSDLKKKAEDLQADYDKLNIKNDQFGAGEASLSVGIALFGITALTKRRWLMIFAGIACLFGLVLGICGFAGWGFRPDWLVRLLGA